MKIASPKLDTANLPANEAALFRCQRALELKKAEDYFGAQEVMRPLWRGIGERPETKGLHPSVAAEVLLCVGVLTCWIGSRSQNKEAQETAKNLISESVTFYESIRDVMKVATARVELAYCYWYAGELNEARIVFNEALQKLTVEGNTKARTVFGLAVVEWSAGRYNDALEILTRNARLFSRINDHTTKAAYHNQLAMVLRKLASSENRPSYLRRAIHEYEQADHHLKLTKNSVARADVKNNVGNVLRQLRRFKEAHKYLEEARRFALRVRDKVRIAQIDESRAQVLIAERKFNEAESVARNAVSTLVKTDRKALLADTLITHGIILARLKQLERSQLCFQRAIEAACQVGVLNTAGLAALSLIEEVEQQLSREELQAAFIQACQWLSECQNKKLLRRLITAAEKVVSVIGGHLGAETATKILLTKSPDLQKAVLKYEGSLIKQALTKANGSVTYAASLLGLSHQGLAYVIESRHKDLLKERTPVRRRSRRSK